MTFLKVKDKLLLVNISTCLTNTHFLANIYKCIRKDYCPMNKDKTYGFNQL